MERTKELESKETLIENLRKREKSNKNVPLDTVEEVVCSSCKNSLEESQIFTGRLSRGGNDN
jgi:hypothetical protein